MTMTGDEIKNKCLNEHKSNFGDNMFSLDYALEHKNELEDLIEFLRPYKEQNRLCDGYKKLHDQELALFFQSKPENIQQIYDFLDYCNKHPVIANSSYNEVEQILGQVNHYLDCLEINYNKVIKLKKKQKERQQKMKDILENIISIQKESKKNELSSEKEPNPFRKGQISLSQNEKTTPIHGGRRDVVGDEVGHIRRYARPCSLCKQGGVIKKNTRKSKKSKKSTRKKKEN